LFIECGFTIRIWRVVLKKCSLSSFPTGWEEVAREGLEAWKGKSLNVLCENWHGELLFITFGDLEIM
jgi:hypothetical protein